MFTVHNFDHAIGSHILHQVGIRLDVRVRILYLFEVGVRVRVMVRVQVNARTRAGLRRVGLGYVIGLMPGSRAGIVAGSRSKAMHWPSA